MMLRNRKECAPSSVTKNPVIGDSDGESETDRLIGDDNLPQEPVPYDFEPVERIMANNNPWWKRGVDRILCNIRRMMDGIRADWLIDVWFSAKNRVTSKCLAVGFECQTTSLHLIESIFKYDYIQEYIRDVVKVWGFAAMFKGKCRRMFTVGTFMYIDSDKGEDIMRHCVAVDNLPAKCPTCHPIHLRALLKFDGEKPTVKFQHLCDAFGN